MTAVDPARLRYRAVFVSDVHLGSAGCRVDEFQQFLSAVDCDYLYLVGDIIDLWVVMKAGKWQQAHTDVVRQILSLSKMGVKIYYTPGNHDAFLRRLNGSDFGNIRIDHSVTHVCADGKRLEVVHGDLLDKSVKWVPIAWAAAWAYESVTVFNGWVNARRKRAGKEQTDFSTILKKRLKKYIGGKTDFEDRLLANALAAGYDGVVCGHIHRPGIQVGDEGGLYINTGDWVEHGTAVVERDDGKLELVIWDDLKGLWGQEPRGETPAVKTKRLFRTRRRADRACASSSTRH